MKKNGVTVIIVIILLAAAGVAAYYLLRGKSEVVLSAPPVQYVSEIISNNSSSEHLMVRNYNADATAGAIFILGSKGRCEQLAGVLMESDVYDNVDGSSRPDGLKDFAGETICTVANFTGFGDMVQNGKGGELRELTVRNVLAAMDTLCYVSPYDRSGMGKKPGAKLVVLGSACMTECGLYDVDSLFNALGCNLPVISPMQLLLDEAARSAKAGKVLTVGVISGNAPAEVYGSFLDKKVAKAGVDSVLCVGYHIPAGENPLISFLDYYSSCGYDKPLDILLVDDLSVDIDQINESLKVITSVMNAESMTYGNLIAPGFKVADTGSRVSKATYHSLRSRNVFTHRISQPRKLDYMILPREDAGKEMMLLQYNERYIPQND
jgi:hypothetical protein